MKLYLTNAGGTQDVTSFVIRVQWSGDEASATRQLSFSILYEEGENWPVPVVGNVITLEEEGETLFNGWVVKRTLDSESISMDVVCYDGGIYLKNNDYSDQFRQETPEAMVAAACAKTGIPVAELAETGVRVNRKFNDPVDKVVRTAYSMAAERTGERYSIRMTPAGLSVTVRQQSESSLELRPRSNLMYATTTESIVDMVNSVGIYDQQGQRVTTVADNAAIELYGTMERHVQQTESSDAYAQAEALLADNGFSQNVTVEVLGDTRLITGETVVVREEHTGLQGLFWIDADQHTWQRDQYTCKLTLNCRNVMTQASAGSEEL